MRKLLPLSVPPFILLLGFAPVSQSADAEAGKAKATTVCAACHGASGVSVGEGFPHLAGQRAGYLEAQLKAFKEGTRKNPLMNAIAAQLSSTDMADLAAFFAAQPGAMADAKSAPPANLLKTQVSFPQGYKESFVKYHTINFPATRQVRYYFANKAAVEAAKQGKALPEGSELFVEVHAAKLDAGKLPVSGADGFFVPEKLLFYTAMARGAGWGAHIPEMLRNGDWNYAVFTAEGKHRPGLNQAPCLACHKPLDDVSYTFTLKELAAARP